MSAADNLSPMFNDHIEVHRGLSDVSPEEVSLQNIGQYWSRSPDVAEGFANFSWSTDSGVSEKQTVISGFVHPKDTEPSEWDEGNMDDPDPEDEVKIKQGSRIHITGVYPSIWEKERGNTFNPPQVGTA